MKATAKVHNMPNTKQTDGNDFVEQSRIAEEESNALIAAEQNKIEAEPEAGKNKKPDAKNEYEEFVSRPPEEILKHYNENISDKEWKDFVGAYEECLEVRDEMTAKMKRLAEWSNDKKIDFATFKHVFKRARKPVKKQNLIDASFAWVAKRLGGGYQPGLFDEADDSAE